MEVSYPPKEENPRKPNDMFTAGVQAGDIWLTDNIEDAEVLSGYRALSEPHALIVLGVREGVALVAVSSRSISEPNGHCHEFRIFESDHGMRSGLAASAFKHGILVSREGQPAERCPCGLLLKWMPNGWWGECPECGEANGCPNCGHAVKSLIGEGKKYHVECPKCGMSGPWCQTVQDAISHWNKSTQRSA